MYDLSYLNVLISIKHVIGIRLINWGMFLVHLKGLKTLTRLWVAILKERFSLRGLGVEGKKVLIVETASIFLGIGCRFRRFSAPSIAI